MCSLRAGGLMKEVLYARLIANGLLNTISGLTLQVLDTKHCAVLISSGDSDNIIITFWFPLPE